LHFRSPEDGNPSIDTPRYTACWTLCSAHCVINSLILVWAGNGEKHNVMRQRNNYKIKYIMRCFLSHFIRFLAGLVCLFLHFYYLFHLFVQEVKFSTIRSSCYPRVTFNSLNTFLNSTKYCDKGIPSKLLHQISRGYFCTVCDTLVRI